MDDAKAQLVDRLSTANNVLVTVSRNPSVDQLAALIGLTLLLNKQGKHAAAVFSGQVPSTIEFLQPEETIETNTDSLRDFIIALDKSKADKLRYKVEDNVVRIFITPYKTSITQEDLDFSQGDFNVDVVVALGVKQQADLDGAITAHGRILHDATIASINTSTDAELGAINWQDPSASSLSELVTELIESLDGSLMDNQIATALLTGIVAETDRFSNAKTSSQTMSMSAMLMAAGANQQLVASKLEEGGGTPPAAAGPAMPRTPTNTPPKNDDGTIEIDHEENQVATLPGMEEDSTADIPEIGEPKIQLDPLSTTPSATAEATTPQEPGSALTGLGNKRITEPPQLGGMLTANTQTEQLAPAVDPLSLPSSEPPQMILSRESPPAAVSSAEPPAPVAEPAPQDLAPAPVSEPEQPPASLPPAPVIPPPPAPEPVIQGLTPPPPAWVPPSDNPLGRPAEETESQETLSQLEAAVASPHAEDTGLNDARSEVTDAINGSENLKNVDFEPLESLNAQPFGGDLHQAPAPAGDIVAPTPVVDAHANNSTSPGPHLDDILNPAPAAPSDAVMPGLGSPTATTIQPLAGSQPAPVTDTPQVSDPTAPPPVPPPIPFQFGTPGAPPTPPA